jgi:hypothetical protein
MPAIDDVVINDAQGTPVAHTFSPNGIRAGVAEFVDRTAAVPAGFLTISNEILKPTKQRPVFRWSNGFYLPVTTEDAGVYSIPRYNTTKLVMDVNPNATLQEKKDQYAYLQNWLANTDVKNGFLYSEPWF